MDIVTYALCKKMIKTASPLRGKNCTIQSVTKIENGTKVVFKWFYDDGSVATSTMNVMDGLSPKNIKFDNRNHLIFIMSDNSEIDAGVIPGIKPSILVVDTFDNLPTDPSEDDIVYAKSDSENGEKSGFYIYNGSEWILKEFGSNGKGVEIYERYSDLPDTGDGIVYVKQNEGNNKKGFYLFTTEWELIDSTNSNIYNTFEELPTDGLDFTVYVKTPTIEGNKVTHRKGFYFYDGSEWQLIKQDDCCDTLGLETVEALFDGSEITSADNVITITRPNNDVITIDESLEYDCCGEIPDSVINILDMSPTGVGPSGGDTCEPIPGVIIQGLDMGTTGTPVTPTPDTCEGLPASVINALF